MQKRKGFTLVELVIVIAVIAILAGVLIGTFASVINKANESAKMQEVKAQEIEQKAEDILKKIEDSNWYGWEDFEVSLATKLEETYKKYASLNNGPTSDQIKMVVKEALEEYGKNNAQVKTSLTEEQVKAIIENALSNASLGGVTEAQVRAIVTSATSQIQGTQLTPVQVKSIVNAATAKNLTAADVAKIVNDVISSSNIVTSADLDVAVEELKSNLEAAQNEALSADDVKEIIKKYLPITDTVDTVDKFNEAVETWNSGSTIIVATTLKNTALTIATEDVKELNIKGLDDTSNVQVNAPYATINFLTNVGTITVKASAMQSVHLFGNVNTLIIEKGRVVLEEGSQVATLTVSALADVVVDVEKTAEVTGTLTVDKTTGSVEINNKGTVDTVAAGDTDAGKAVFNNIGDGKITNSTSADTANGVTDNHIIIFDKDGNNENVEVVMNLDELLQALSKEKSYIKFGANITTVASTEKLINITYSMILDGNGYTLDGPGGLRATSSSTVPQMICVGNEATQRIGYVTIKNIVVKPADNVKRPLECRGNVDSVTLENVTLLENNCSPNAQGFTYGGNESTALKLTVRDCNLSVNKSGYVFIFFNHVDMVVENSTLTGWAGLYFKGPSSSHGSRESVVNVNNSVFTCPNIHSGPTNSFGAIVFEDKDIDVALVDTYIDVTQKGDQAQDAILFSNEWAKALNDIETENIHVIIKGASTINGSITNYSVYSIGVSIESGTYINDPSEWIANGSTVKQEGDYYIVEK